MIKVMGILVSLSILHFGEPRRHSVERGHSELPFRYFYGEHSIEALRLTTMYVGDSSVDASALPRSRWSLLLASASAARAEAKH
jgi:hypothetical protein